MNNLSIAQLAGLALLAIGCSSGDPDDAVVPEAAIPEGVTIVVDGTAQPTYMKGLVGDTNPDFQGEAGGYSGDYVIEGESGTLSFSATEIYGFSEETALPADAFPATSGVCLLVFGKVAGSYESIDAGITVRLDGSLYLDTGDTKIIVAEYGAVGERIKGSFSSTLFPDANENGAQDPDETTMRSAAGTFNIPRLPDYLD